MIDLYRGYWNCCVFDFPMLCVWVLQWKCHHYFQTITSVNAMTILQISSSKRWASTFIFFFLLLLCVVPSRLDADWGTFIKIHFIQIHIANPKPQSGPPPSQELDKILDFFPCLSLCVCLHTHTPSKVTHCWLCIPTWKINGSNAHTHHQPTIAKQNRLHGHSTIRFLQRSENTTIVTFSSSQLFEIVCPSVCMITHQCQCTSSNNKWKTKAAHGNATEKYDDRDFF